MVIWDIDWIRTCFPGLCTINAIHHQGKLLDMIKGLLCRDIAPDSVVKGRTNLSVNHRKLCWPSNIIVRYIFWELWFSKHFLHLQSSVGTWLLLALRDNPAVGDLLWCTWMFPCDWVLPLPSIMRVQRLGWPGGTSTGYEPSTSIQFGQTLTSPLLQFMDTLFHVWVNT